ncbi:hypothetical protein NA57DRAFT_38761 [Rhizodiscina lignyota]|uniref:Oxysterol-binding protein n=1 Tax=Rhizodiscina lignyota TaxID=1504668 RepID=A0A9P4IIV2_9PEZI|nr:hypothetical protein NA57DRAFT_38761 [Rhizodiscina lignyota]
MASTSTSANGGIDSSLSSPPPTAPVEKAPDDGSKFKTFISILRRFIGVADLAAVRFSLPAQLLEPTPNLEYWGYLDRPETFISIGDSDEPLGRMLGTLRFWFTKDLKYVKSKPVKPYNSVLGEFFRCNWEVEDTLPEPQHQPSAPASGASSMKSAVIKQDNPARKVKISYLTEQTSHHPPVSAFYIDCPEKGIIARGYDQLSAKFTGTSIRVTAGSHNLGIYITLQNRGDEEYQLTHPAAYLGGFLRGSLNVTVADQCFITCPKNRIKVILHYVEEGWIGRTQNKVEGIIFNYDPQNDKYTKMKDVPDKDILGRIEGVWVDKVYYTLGSQPFSKNPEKFLLADMGPLTVVPKDVPSMDQQLPNESRRYWKDVTSAIKNKQYSLATTLKQEIEERQRQKAAERKETAAEWQPRFFTGSVTPIGKPDLTEEGKNVLDGMHKGDFQLKENDVYGA